MILISPKIKIAIVVSVDTQITRKVFTSLFIFMLKKYAKRIFLYSVFYKYMTAEVMQVCEIALLIQLISNVQKCTSERMSNSHLKVCAVFALF